MTRFHVLLFACIASAWAGLASADVSLPLVADAEFQDLQGQCARLRRALEALKKPLAPETAKALEGVPGEGSKDPASAVVTIQKLLDPLCLVQVSINPESRVKAARGPARAELVLGEEKVFLIKVHNEAGVTHALTVSGLRVRQPKQSDAEGWLEAEVYAGPPMRKELSGQKLEYVILRLRPRESGKREATLKFDVGQGTQDLGFRAEVPILFTIRSR